VTSTDGRGLVKALKIFDGWCVKMWFYTVSHSELVLRLEKPRESQYTYLVLSGCGDIVVPELSEVKGVQVERNGDLRWTLSFHGFFKVTAEAWRLERDYPFPDPAGVMDPKILSTS